MFETEKYWRLHDDGSLERKDIKALPYSCDFVCYPYPNTEGGPNGPVPYFPFWLAGYARVSRAQVQDLKDVYRYGIDRLGWRFSSEQVELALLMALIPDRPVRR